MIILIDIGNTRTKYCTLSEGQRSISRALLNENLSSEFLNKTFIDATSIIMASVNDDTFTELLDSWCQLNDIRFDKVVSEKYKNNVVCGYQTPTQFGVDRWLTLVGAESLFPNESLLIIDAGTATTLDFLLSTGQHQGGWILAGINTLISSVLADTTLVKAKPDENESLIFGTTTSENVHNAAWAATIGTIDLAIKNIHDNNLIVDKVIITGGNGKALSSLMSHQNIVIEDLVFSGLQAYI
jgi:type III pantothenate kinase